MPTHTQLLNAAAHLEGECPEVAAMLQRMTEQPSTARACEVLTQGEWVLYPLQLAAEAAERGWPVRYLVPAGLLATVMQRAMARLADLLDEDQFAEIEGIVTNAGVTPPAPTQQPLTSWQRNEIIMRVKTVGEAIDMVEAVHNITGSKKGGAA